MRRKAAEVAQSLTKSELEQSEDVADEGEAADETFTLADGASDAAKSTSSAKAKSKAKAKASDHLPTRRGGVGGIYLSDEEEEKEANKQSLAADTTRPKDPPQDHPSAKDTESSGATSKVDELWQSMQQGSVTTKRMRNSGGISGLMQRVNKKKKRKKAKGATDNSLAFLLRPAKAQKSIDKDALKRAAREALSKTGKMKVKESVKFAGAVVRYGALKENMCIDDGL